MDILKDYKNKIGQPN